MNQLRIGKFIAKLRHEKDLTQEQLGNKIGVSSKTISSSLAIDSNKEISGI